MVPARFYVIYWIVKSVYFFVTKYASIRFEKTLTVNYVYDWQVV